MPKELILCSKLISILKNIDDNFSKILLEAHNNKDCVVDYSYISYSTIDGMISFLPSNREYRAGVEIPESEKWTVGRQTTSIGKLLRMVLIHKKISYKETELEKFVNHYKYLQSDFIIKLVKGEDIIKWYKVKNYDNTISESGSLFGSCMRDVSSDFFNIYKNNKDISMLCAISKETNKLLGRAIVWNNALINGEKATFVDRIYSIKDSHELAIKNYCSYMGWFFKTRQGTGNYSITDGVKIYETPKIIFKLNEKISWENGNKPYMDTLAFFGYLHEDKKIPALTNIDNSNYLLKFRDTGGGFSTNSYYDGRKDIFKNRISGNSVLIKYDDGHEWIDDTNHNYVAGVLSHKKYCYYTYKLIKDGVELIAIRGIKYRNELIRNVSNIDFYISDKDAIEKHIYLFDIFKEDFLFSEKYEKTYEYLSSSPSFKLSNLSKEHFEMVLKDCPDLISKRIKNLPKENIETILNINPQIIDNLSISDFVHLANLEYINKEVVDKYLVSLKCPYMTYKNGKILMRVSKKIIKRYTNNYEDIDGNDNEVLINVQSHWFGYISVGTKIKCQLPIKDKLLNFVGIKKLPTNMVGVVTSSSRYRNDIYAKFTRGKKTIIIKCDDIKYEVIESDLRNDVYLNLSY